MVLAFSTPYGFKCLWAPGIDRVSLGPLTRCFGQRRGRLLLTQAALIAATFGLAASDPVDHNRLYRSLWICGVLQLLSNLMFAVQAMVGTDLALLAVTIGFENLAGGMGTAVFVAYLSSLCNLSYTATQYALVSSFMAVARTWLSSSAGYLAEWFGWVDFVLLTTLAAVPGLVLLWWLTRQSAATRPGRPGRAMEGGDG